MKRGQRHSLKRDEAMRIVDYIVESFRPGDNPVIVMWREMRNGQRLKISPDNATWGRDTDEVHQDFNRFGPEVIKTLRARQLTVVKVGRQIRDLFSGEMNAHNHRPDRGGRRTDLAYRQCIPSSSNKAFGMVLFPRDTDEDHPLIIADNERRMGRNTTALENGVAIVRDTNDLGNLSVDKTTSILTVTRDKVYRALDESRYPLFARVKELPPTLPPAPPADPEAL